jgi:hypothetical protein
MARKVFAVMLLGLLACAALANAEEPKVSAQAAVSAARELQRAWKRSPKKLPPNSTLLRQCC